MVRLAQSVEGEEKTFELYFGGCNERASRMVAQEIYDTLCSIHLLLPQGSGKPVERKASQQLLRRIDFTQFGAQLKLEKLHQIELMSSCANGITNVMAFRVIAVDFHPHLYGRPF